jgi:CDP-diacylglycerol--glycerol-3-phosphate 3-phosphatidyltransferase
VICALILSEFFLLALILFSLAAATDLFDGMLARKKLKVSDFGKFFDPMADKILIFSCFIFMVKLDLVNCWSVVLLLIRDFLISTLRLIASKNHHVIAANFWGKFKTFLQFLSVILIISSLLFTGKFGMILLQVSHLFLWMSVALAWISMVVCFRDLGKI